VVKKQNSIFRLYVLIKVASFGLFSFYFKVEQVSADKFSFIQQGLHTNGNNNCLKDFFFNIWGGGGILKKKKEEKKKKALIALGAVFKVCLVLSSEISLLNFTVRLCRKKVTSVLTHLKK